MHKRRKLHNPTRQQMIDKVVRLLEQGFGIRQVSIQNGQSEQPQFGMYLERKNLSPNVFLENEDYAKFLRQAFGVGATTKNADKTFTHAFNFTK